MDDVEGAVFGVTEVVCVLQTFADLRTQLGNVLRGQPERVPT